MKKFATALITVCFALVCTACGTSPHSHNFKTISETAATCTEDGTTLRRCECGETDTKTTRALGHNYSTVSDTTTCIDDGIKISECVRCGARKQESVQAFGHKFGNTGYCSLCENFKYNITLSRVLPAQMAYAYKSISDSYSKCSVEKITFQVKDYIRETFLYITAEGKKTYDKKGAFGTHMASFMVVLREKDTDIIVSSTTISEMNLIVGEAFSVTERLIDVSKLDVQKSYILQLVDRIA